MSERLHWFTPLPPARNGIADYSALLLHEMASMRTCHVYSDDIGTDLPGDVAICDPRQAYRHLTAQSPILHQIGNNGGHVFVLKALREFGGVTSLHDLSLLYLYELASDRLEDVLACMPGPTGRMGEVYARHWKENGIKTAANYVLFDTIGEVLFRSRRLIVHSEYARKKIVAVHGDAARARIDVIPHFAPRLKAESHEAARAALGIPEHEMLILTSGFATRAKRFDWLIDALDELAQAGRAFRWVHAGEERASEYDLSGEIAKRPALTGRCTISGYVTEELLDAYISAADIVVNLRFPSVGESSGTLARAFSAGRCCIVNDTAAYAEIPRDVVVHVPVFGTVAALVRALDGLIDAPDLRHSFGERARLFARTELSLESVCARYLASVDEAYRAPKRSRKKRGTDLPSLEAVAARRTQFHMADGEGVQHLCRFIDEMPGTFEAVLWFDSPEDFAGHALTTPSLLRDAVGAHVRLGPIHFIPHENGRGIGLSIEGRSYACVSHRS